MTSPSNDDIYTDITVHEQLQQLQNEMDKLRRSNEVLKISGRDLLERAPPLIDIPHRSNMLQQTLEDIIEKQETEIHRLRDELERDKCRCLIAIHELELKLEGQLKKYELQKTNSMKKYIF